MKFIFLDIDGVLNYANCRARSSTGCIGIENEPLKLLKHIVEETGAKIVLTSTWKTDWFKTDYIEDLPKDGQYLIKKFSQVRLGILDKTVDKQWSMRGQGILDYLKDCYCDGFVILDDETFDFFELGLDKYLVKTSFFNGGLTTSHAERAINILKRGIYNNDCQS